MQVRTLFLILASTHYINIADEIAQRDTWAAHPIETSEIIWLRGSCKIERPIYSASERTLYVPIEETQENILKKTILGVEWCLENRKFDVLIRTNTSSYFHVNQLKLERFVSNTPIFGGYLEMMKSSINKLRTKFITGSGIFLNYESCKLLLSLDPPSFIKSPDDVSISEYLFAHNASFLHVKRSYIHSLGLFVPYPYQRLKSSVHHEITFHRMRRVHSYFLKEKRLEKLYEFAKINLYELKYFATSSKRRIEVIRNLFGLLRIYMVNHRN